MTNAFQNTNTRIIAGIAICLAAAAAAVLAFYVFLGPSDTDKAISKAENVLEEAGMKDAAARNDAAKAVCVPDNATPENYSAILKNDYGFDAKPDVAQKVLDIVKPTCGQD
ncbi:hypothetical protein AB0C51_16815 [Streptomyces pathocidini]|uniref:hypothetical protein n=1 Tax=Streptomyces pathocidini TaxID=1650571 RepID=UPI0033D19264